MTGYNEGLRAEDLDEVRRLEKELRVAMLAGDAGALAALLDDRLVFTAPDGSLLSKQQDLAAHETGWLKLWAIDVTEASFHRVDAMVLTTTKANLSGSFGGTAFAGPFAYTRLWSRSSGRWCIAAGHASAIAF